LGSSRIRVGIREYTSDLKAQVLFVPVSVCSTLDHFGRFIDTFQYAGMIRISGVGKHAVKVTRQHSRKPLYRYGCVRLYTSCSFGTWCTGADAPAAPIGADSPAREKTDTDESTESEPSEAGPRANRPNGDQRVGQVPHGVEDPSGERVRRREAVQRPVRAIPLSWSQPSDRRADAEGAARRPLQIPAIANVCVRDTSA